MTFGIIAVGQIVSIFGTALTGFGLGVWVFQESGSVLQFGIIALCAGLPATLLAPIAGALVDRWDKRRVMLVTDAIGAGGTVVIWILLGVGNLELWHIYAVSVLGSLAGAFQWPAFFAAMPTLVAKAQFVRAAGLVRTGGAASRILAPLGAGMLLEPVGLQGLLAIDLATFAVAAATLLLVRLPRSEMPAGGRRVPSIWREAGDGWRWIVHRPGFLTLLLVFAGINFGTGMVTVLLTPLMLSIAGAAELGVVVAAGAAGSFLGGLAISTWGGPRQRLAAVFGFSALGSVLLAVAGLVPSTAWVAVGYFGFMACIPIAQACSQALWQVKVPLEFQGRVISIRRAVATAAMPIAYLLCGPLADHVFEPMLAKGGRLADSVGSWIGTGPGRGIGLMIVLVAVGNLVVLAVGWLRPRLRRLETEIPDAFGDEPPAPADGDDRLSAERDDTAEGSSDAAPGDSVADATR